MKSFSDFAFLQEYCRATGKFGMMISFDSLEAVMATEVPKTPIEECLNRGRDIKLACPYINQLGSTEMVDGKAYLIFDTEAEMLMIFEMTVGDDGPTSLNDYDGKARVYAKCCWPTDARCADNS